MRFKISRKFPMMLVAVLMCGLAACSGAAAPTTVPPTQAPAANPTAVPATQAPAQPTAAATGRTFKIWHYEAADSAMGVSWDNAMKEFQAAHPDVKLEFELKTFDQIQQTGQMILNSDDTPDLMEVNKGNATAGLYAKQGLLTDLSDVATQRGWDKLLPPSIQTTSRYDDKGIMGSGPIYGIPNYGEFVMVYYNKNLFAKYGIQVPTTYDEFNAAADKFVKAGVTPIAIGLVDKWPVTQNFYELALYKADRNFITNYETFKSDVNFQGPEFTYAADQLSAQFKNGYYSAGASGTGYSDANAAFVQGKYPMNLTGSWMFGSFLTSIKDFDWGLFVMPGKKFNTGSGGNLWAVPKNAKNKDLAYDFIDLTLNKENQTLMANSGGIPLNADLAQIKDPHIKELNTVFSDLVKNDALAFYPDWPAPGYMDVLGGGLQDLVLGTKTTPQFLDAIAGPWNDYKATLK